jgi:hypothetical protein
VKQNVRSNGGSGPIDPDDDVPPRHPLAGFLLGVALGVLAWVALAVLLWQLAR